MRLESWLMRALLLTLIVPVGKVPGINFFIHDVVLFIALLARLIQSDKAVINRHIAMGFFLLILLYAPGSITSVNPDEYFTSIVQIFTIGLLLNYFWMAGKAQLVSVDELKGCLLYSVIASNVVCYLVFFDILAYEEKTVWVAGRFSGIYGNPNLFAKILAVNIVLIWAILGRWTLMALLAIISCVPLLLSTGSASGVIYLSASLLIILVSLLSLRSLSESIKLTAFVLTVSLVLSLNSAAQEYMAIFSERLVDRVFSVQHIDDVGSGSEKLDQLIYGLGIAFDNILFGVGIENGKYVNYVSYDIHREHVSFHWFIVTVLVEGGILVLGVVFSLAHSLLYLAKGLGVRYFVLVLFLFFVFFVSTNLFNRFFFVIPGMIIYLNTYAKSAKL